MRGEWYRRWSEIFHCVFLKGTDNRVELEQHISHVLVQRDAASRESRASAQGDGVRGYQQMSSGLMCRDKKRQVQLFIVVCVTSELCTGHMREVKERKWSYYM